MCVDHLLDRLAPTPRETPIFACAISPSTGSFAASCEWTSQSNAVRLARKKCRA
jgi:hypothetical protein